MKKFSACLILASVLLPSCATSHAVRYAYGSSSVFQEEESDDTWRAVYGGPLILGSIGWDLITWPAQLLFGVWPLWGSSSLSMEPDSQEE
jgi:hypothetical protein